jgi:hypothetical protein
MVVGTVINQLFYWQSFSRYSALQTSTIYYPNFFKSFSKFMAMDRKLDISVEEKTKTLCLAHEGVQTADINARLGHHLAAVRKHIAAFKKLPLITPHAL